MSTRDEDNNHAEKGVAAVLWRRGRQAKQGYDWADRINWILSLFKSPAEMAVAVGSLGVIGAVGGMTLVEAVGNRGLDTSSAGLVETERSTPSATVFTIEGWDKSGRRAVFDVVVAKKEFMWVRGSAEELEKEGRIIKADAIAGEVFDTEVTTALGSAREIIAVGTASQEGEPEQEKARAGRRAQLTADLAAKVAQPGTPVSTLNLGQYREPCAACETSGTSWQRPFIVVAAKDVEGGCNVGEALADALTGKTRLPSPASYSTFEITKSQ